MLVLYGFLIFDVGAIFGLSITALAVSVSDELSTEKRKDAKTVEKRGDNWLNARSPASQPADSTDHFVRWEAEL